METNMSIGSAKKHLLYRDCFSLAFVTYKKALQSFQLQRFLRYFIYNFYSTVSPECFFDPLYNSYFLKLHSNEPFRIGIFLEGRNPMDFKHCGVLIIHTVASE